MTNDNLYNIVNFKEPLSHEQQKKYFLLASQGDENAKKIILEHNLRLITLVINRYYYNFNNDFKKELFSVGYLELWKCIQNFNINLGTEFSTYAIPSISGSIKRYLRDNKQFRIPRSILTLATNILNFENESNQQYSNLELANKFQVSEKDINLAKGCNQPILSINQPVNDSDTDDIHLHEIIADENFVIYENIEKEEVFKDLKIALNKLPEKYKLVITLSFGLNGEVKKQSDIGKLLGLNQSKVSRLKSQSLKLLKKYLPRYIREEYEKKYTISKK